MLKSVTIKTYLQLCLTQIIVNVGDSCFCFKDHNVFAFYHLFIVYLSSSSFMMRSSNDIKEVVTYILSRCKEIMLEMHVLGTFLFFIFFIFWQYQSIFLYLYVSLIFYIRNLITYLLCIMYFDASFNHIIKSNVLINQFGIFCFILTDNICIFNQLNCFLKL